MISALCNVHVDNVMYMYITQMYDFNHYLHWLVFKCNTNFSNGYFHNVTQVSAVQ